MIDRNIKLFVVWLAVAFFFAAAAAAFVAPAGVSVALAGEAGAQAPLTPQERRGKVIYLRGESPSGKEITALLGEVDVPASTLTCAGCHGLRGEGKAEGGVTAGALSWAHLTKSYGHTHPSGRKHGPFSEASFIRSVTGGVDPDGNELVVAMPRFQMSAADMADLIAYLKRIETDRDPGLTTGAVRIGALLPAKGPLAETGVAMRDVLSAYFEEVNGRGGIYNRRLELRVAETGADEAATVAVARRLITDEQVFALVGGLSAGADRGLAALARDEEVPFVGPSTLLPQTGAPVNRYVFYLLPGLAEQARALVNFAASRPGLKASRLAVVHAEGELAAAAAGAVEAQAAKVGWGAVVTRTYRRGSFEAPALVRSLRGEGVGAVFLLCNNGEEALFIKEAAAGGWAPHVLLLGALAGGGLAGAVPAEFRDKVFLSFSSVPADHTPEGMAEFRALHAKYKLAPRHTAAQLSAFAAAKVFVEGLKRAGQDLGREKLVTALEGFYDYETGVTPRLTFGPNRRVGAAGAYVVTIDPEKKQFFPASGWVGAN